MNTIEIALMCELWNDILQHFNSSSKLLQSNTDAIGKPERHMRKASHCGSK